MEINLLYTFDFGDNVISQLLIGCGGNVSQAEMISSSLINLFDFSDQPEIMLDDTLAQHEINAKYVESKERDLSNSYWYVNQLSAINSKTGEITKLVPVRHLKDYLVSVEVM
ncbi:hypothetical protein [Listeria seeligeri]|uniref:Uncharacterized protein n=1 Tax=Listeria seeligeri TaxID=1640 RepID=A0A7T0MAR3_LISSE|nr:hypothetical protein [Listeria seeligeri]MBC1917042.1 hypothetical protein [Listeria seeligeri]QPL19421.1 hypothetical protein pLIS400431c [Listeria seeligeri]